MANDFTLALSADGKIRDPLKRLDNQLSRFIVSEFNQTPYVENRFSLPYLLARFQENDDGLEEAVKEALEVSFRENFPSVKVETSVKVHPERQAWRALYMSLTIRDAKGNGLNAARLVTTEGSKFIEIARVNNGSLPYTA